MQATIGFNDFLMNNQLLESFYENVSFKCYKCPSVF
jgi:hypothetical protein